MRLVFREIHDMDVFLWQIPQGFRKQRSGCHVRGRVRKLDEADLVSGLEDLERLRPDEGED